MKPERWRQIEQLYHAAREREPAGRGAFLAEACGNDEELRREVESLVAQDGSTATMLSPAELPAIDGGANLLDDSTVTQLGVGSQLGPYRIESRLGAGGMGQVYKARDTRLGRAVAIKVTFAKFSERFQREARAISALNHPHICTLFDIGGMTSGSSYLVMELIDGQDLKGPLPIETALKYASQIAEALEAAHEKGFVHRDLKPANIRITSAGAVKVLDFGLVKALEEPRPLSDGSSASTQTLSVTRKGTIMGTAAYMSPEQAQGSDADRRADIWSFGAVLYELLAGKRAFEGKSMSETLMLVLGSQPDWSALPDQTPPAVCKLLRQCLRKDRQQRLQAIGDARIALQELNSGIDTELDAARPPETQRARLLPWAVAVGVLTLAAASGWFIAWREARTVEHPLLRLNVDLGPDAVSTSNSTAAISPDGTRLVFLVRTSNGSSQLATRLLDQSQATVLAGTEDASDPFFKPDGEWIGFFAQGKMKKVSVRGGAVVRLCEAAHGRGAAWGEDGNIIATLDDTTGVGLSRVADKGGIPQALTNPGEKGQATHRWPQILPGGQAVLFMANKQAATYDDSTIDVLSLKTGKVKEVLSGGYYPRYLADKKGSGYLVYVHQGTLFGVPFDLDSLEVRGTAAVLLDDVAGDANTAGGQFDFSGNGTFVYLSGKGSTGTWTLVWLDSDGKSQSFLAPAFYYNPRFSPDGKRLAFGNGSDIEVYDRERGTLERLPSKFQTTNFYPLWTGDGKHIIFQSQATTNWSLQWIRADGAGEAQTLRESRNRVAPHSLSLDGKRLAFSEQSPETGYDLWTLPLDTSDPNNPKPGQPELFLRTPFDEIEAAFSPDGRWIAYMSNESGGRNEVYVRPFPPRPGRSTVSTGGGSSPIWSGDSLFYLGPDNRLMTATYTAKGDSFTSQKPRLWLDGLQNIAYGMDRTPDGRRFVVSRWPQAEPGGEPKGSVHVTFLLNFFDEVRRRIPSGQ